MRKVRTFLVVFCVAIAGCHHQSDPTNENFSVAIQAYLDSLPGACIMSPAQSIPFTLYTLGNGLPGSSLTVARGLESAGLLRADAHGKVAEGSSNNDTVVFSLTDEGKKYFNKGSGVFPQFCGGKRKLHGIQSAQVVKSPTGTRAIVYYDYELVEQPSWMKNSNLRGQHPDLDIQRTLNDQTLLTQTNNGWTP